MGFPVKGHIEIRDKTHELGWLRIARGNPRLCGRSTSPWLANYASNLVARATT